MLVRSAVWFTTHEAESFLWVHSLVVAIISLPAVVSKVLSSVGGRAEESAVSVIGSGRCRDLLISNDGGL